jgi:putative multiple sugar transport system ATP-binding protein
MGAGRTEFAKSLFGRSYGVNISGDVKMNGKPVQFKTVVQAIKSGLAYVTEDRKGDGLVLENPIAANMTLANLEEVSKNMVLDKNLEILKAKELKQDLNVKCASVMQNVGNLSGGNQQKVLLAKWMLAHPEVLILDEPTRGIDVGAKYEIYCLINKLVEAGKAVLMISSELPEVLGMSDRIYVMNEGKIVGEMPRSEASQESIMGAILRTSGKKHIVEQ